jgi:predicted O-linked N-acetylglucosamine transferase (SPINDLY family)
LHAAGRLDHAEQLYREVLDSAPRHAAANHGIGLLRLHANKPQEGLPHLLTALEQAAEIPDYWLGYLEALLAVGNLAEAAATLKLGCEHGLAGAAVDDFARRLAAKSAPTAAQSIAPAPLVHADRAERRRNQQRARARERELMGLLRQGNFSGAKSLAEQMTVEFPEHSLGWKTLGALLWAEDKKAEALEALRRAVDLAPDDAEARSNLGVSLTKVELYREAEQHLRAALRLNPNDAVAHCSIADLCQMTGRNAEAEASLRLGMSLQSGPEHRVEDLRRHTSLLFLLSHNPAVDPGELFEEHRRFGEKLEQGLRSSWPKHPNARDPARPLNIGFVSADLNSHAVANFVEPVIAKLRENPEFALFAYYNNHSNDGMTAHLRTFFHHWRDVLRLTDQQLAKRIGDDAIDILIDLSGHSTLNRLPAFAHKPAPIQASWIGYPGTTGLAAMDYYFADRHYLPPGLLDHRFTEKLVFLPATAPFQPYPKSPPVNALPALQTGRLTFGSFNRLAKISAAAVDCWAALMRAVPDAGLLVGGISTDNPDDNPLSDRLVAAGIGIERVRYYRRGTLDAYLALHHQVDLCLDTYPYTGGTTTYHALWMGVPTLTIAGSTAAGRQGAAMPGHLGIDGFVAADQDDFVAKGVYWSQHLQELAAIRARIRELWQASSDQKPEVIAAGLARALRHMWIRWCAGDPPESFHA